MGPFLLVGVVSSCIDADSKHCNEYDLSSYYI